MKVIPLSSVIIAPDRQRQHFDLSSLLDLVDDILEHGLIHAPVVQLDSPTLVAGERRLRAIEIISARGLSYKYSTLIIPPNHIPVIPLASNDTLGYAEIELAENLARLDLTWQERAAAIQKLMALREERDGAPPQKQEIAAEIFHTPTPTGNQIQQISTDALLAKALEDPTISKIKDKKQALKSIKLKLQNEHIAQLASSFALASPHSPHTLLHEDCAAALSSLEPSSFDCLLSDPIYGVGAHTFGSQTTINHEYDDSYETWKRLMPILASSSYRITKPQAHAYVFCDIRRWSELSSFFSAAGWDVWPTPLIWYKGNQGTLPRPNHGPRRSYETILYAIKGDRQVLSVGALDVITTISTVDKIRHAAEKPVALFRYLLSLTCLPGNTVIDPFAGSGTIFPAATSLSLSATGIEVDEKYYSIARTRLEEKYDE